MNTIKDTPAADRGSDSSEGLGGERTTLAECEAAGERAGRELKPFDACPYQFVRAEVDQATFEAHWRPRLDSWFRGWIRTSPPIRKKYSPRWHKPPNGRGNRRRQASGSVMG